MAGVNISARSTETLTRVAREHFLTDANVKPLGYGWQGTANGIPWSVHVSKMYDGDRKVTPEFRRPGWCFEVQPMWVEMETVATPEEAMVAIMRRVPSILRGIDLGDS